MRSPTRGYGARRGWWPPSPAMVTILVVLIGLVSLWAAGLIDLGRLRFGGKAGQPSRAGMIAIPVSAMAVPAYTRLNRDHLWNPTLGEFSVIYLQPEQVSPEMIREMGQVTGRVLDHDKPAGYVFTEADFLPKGTRPGLVAGIPPGKRALRVDAEKVYGLQGLRRGDRFDLVSTIALDASRGGTNFGGGGVYAPQMELQSKMMNWQKQATVSVVVQNGVVVEPMTLRNVPTSSGTLTQGMVTRTKPVQEVVIAIDPREVAHLTEAMAVDARISCVPRSGRPEDPPAVTTAPSMPRSPFATGTGVAPLTTIESITGTKREMIAAPKQR